MKNILSKLGLAGVLALSILVAGCLVSGTFVVVHSFSFTTQTGYYLEAIDLTDNDTWEEHKDDIDRIDVVGFELWITNNETQEWSFWAFADDYDENCLTEVCADGSTTKFLIFDTLTVPAGGPGASSQKFVSYDDSFGYLANIEKLRALVKGGLFNYYGYATGGAGGLGGKVDSVRVIITLSASDT